MRDVEEKKITLCVLAHTDEFDGLTVGDKRDEVLPIRLDAINKFKRCGPEAIFCLDGHVVAYTGSGTKTKIPTSF
eukprot:13565528-Ditylum_brightwellii.AAC.1